MVLAARPRGAARREALLEAVLEIVASDGPEAVTHRRVAEVAELPLASTTYWFSSKDELLAAALELAARRDIERLRSRFAALTERAGGGEGQWLLQRVVQLLAEPLQEGLRHSRASLIAAYSLWFEAARRPALRALARAWTHAYEETFSALLERAGVADAHGAAQLLIAAADGLAMAELAGGGQWRRSAHLQRLVRALAACS